MKLFVAGLPSDFDEVDIKEMFELYGDVTSAKLILDRVTGKTKGFGFVTMPDDAEARLTIQTLDGVTLKGGKKISVKEAEAQNPSGGNDGNRDRGNNFPRRPSNNW